MFSRTSSADFVSALVRIGVFVAIGVASSAYVVLRPQDGLVARIVSAHSVLSLSGEHLGIVLVSSLLAALTAIPLGILLTRPRVRRWAPQAIALINIAQTIPSLAVIALSVGLLGVGAKTAIIALWGYSLLPILHNTLVGLDGVDRATIVAAEGIGMRPARILGKIEALLALPMMIAGVRTAVTINIGSAILAAFVGGGGLGNLIIAGNNISRMQVLALGATLPVLMALSADVAFELVEQRARDWCRGSPSPARDD
jgi:osmoprotectant transport system permease protein